MNAVSLFPIVHRLTIFIVQRYLKGIAACIIQAYQNLHKPANAQVT